MEKEYTIYKIVDDDNLEEFFSTKDNDILNFVLKEKCDNIVKILSSDKYIIVFFNNHVIEIKL